MNLKQSEVHGHQPVTGRGPDGTFRADKFHADRNTNLLTLTECADDASLEPK